VNPSQPWFCGKHEFDRIGNYGEMDLMKIRLVPRCLTLANAAILAGFLVAAFLAIPQVFPQNPQLQERVAEIKQAAAANKQLLAQYTWQELQTISIKGEVKKQQQFLVRLGPDGKPQKTEINPQDQAASGGRQRGLKHHVVEKKKEEFADYAKQIAALAQSYARPDPGRLQQLFQLGNITLGSAGAPDVVQLLIRDYLKPGDSVTLVFNREQKALESISVSSYLSDPKDVVTLSAEFTREPGGPSHVSNMTINGVSKQLTVAVRNSNYQKL
jgi:hypothetical protein